MDPPPLMSLYTNYCASEEANVVAPMIMKKTSLSPDFSDFFCWRHRQWWLPIVEYLMSPILISDKCYIPNPVSLCTTLPSSLKTTSNAPPQNESHGRLKSVCSSTNARGNHVWRIIHVTNLDGEFLIYISVNMCIHISSQHPPYERLISPLFNLYSDLLILLLLLLLRKMEGGRKRGVYYHPLHTPHPPYNLRNDRSAPRVAAYSSLLSPVDEDEEKKNEPRRMRRGHQANIENARLAYLGRVYMASYPPDLKELNVYWDLSM